MLDNAIYLLIRSLSEQPAREFFRKRASLFDWYWYMPQPPSYCEVRRSATLAVEDLFNGFIALQATGYGGIQQTDKSGGINGSNRAVF